MKRVWGVSRIGIIVAVVVAAMAAWLFSPHGGPTLDVRDAYRKSAAGQLVLIDIRRPSEWRETGVPETGHAITMHQDEKAFLRAVHRATGGDHTRAIGLICAAGVRSKRMQSVLEKHRYPHVYDVAAGMTGGYFGKGWIQAGLPVRKWTPDRSQPGLRRVQPQ